MSGTIDLIPRAQGGPLITPDFLDLVVNTALNAKASISQTATGSTTARTLPDRFGDWLNVKDFGAVLDGTTDDSAAFNAARAAAVKGQTIYVPEGAFHAVTWTGQDLTKPVRWQMDGGTTFVGGGAILTMGPANAGDITDNMLLNTNGIIKFHAKRTNPTTACDMHRWDYILDATGGLGQIGSALTLNAIINATNDSALWAMNIVADNNSVNPASSGLVGLSVTTRKNSAANTQGIHVSALDTTGLPSSSGRGFSAIETANRFNGLDDASNAAVWGGIGNRVNMHISTTLQQINTDETNAFCILFPSTDAAAPHLYVKSVILCGLNTQAYSVYDARGVIPPYVSVNPVIAVNMAAGMVVDFNGGPDLSSAPGNYLQYQTSGTDRLRYMAGATEVWSVPDTGAFNTLLSYSVAGTKVIGARDTGWTAMTGTPDKATAFATSTVTLSQLAGRVMSLQAALTAHGIVGA
jgi:hypothetical protein